MDDFDRGLLESVRSQAIEAARIYAEIAEIADMAAGDPEGTYGWTALGKLLSDLDTHLQQVDGFEHTLRHLIDRHS